MPEKDDDQINFVKAAFHLQYNWIAMAGAPPGVSGFSGMAVIAAAPLLIG